LISLCSKSTFLSEFFSLVRKERKGQKEECFPLLNTFRRLAATGANTLPRPSNYSIVTATGSKRSSADSDSLLCHVGLWRTSRFKFWRKYGCEHSEIGFISAVPSARILESRPPCTFSGRADNACTNLFDFFVRYVRTRGITEIAESAKLTTCTINLCRTHLPRMARATNSCTPRWLQGGRRESSLLTFAALFVSEKRDKRKVFLRFYTAAASLTQSQRRRHTRSAYVSIPTAVGGRHRLLRKRRAKTLIAARQNFSQVQSKVK